MECFSKKVPGKRPARGGLHAHGGQPTISYCGLCWAHAVYKKKRKRQWKRRALKGKKDGGTGKGTKYFWGHSCNQSRAAGYGNFHFERLGAGPTSIETQGGIGWKKTDSRGNRTRARGERPYSSIHTGLTPCSQEPALSFLTSTVKLFGLKEARSTPPVTSAQRLENCNSPPPTVRVRRGRPSPFTKRKRKGSRADQGKGGLPRGETGG